jgi:hypothetical protein
MRVPPPLLNDGDGGDKLLWDVAAIALVPTGMLLAVCLAGPAPVVRFFGAGCGVVMAKITWVLRAPRPNGNDHWGGGDDPWPEPPAPPSGGDGIDWEALERTGDTTSPERRDLVSV